MVHNCRPQTLTNLEGVGFNNSLCVCVGGGGRGEGEGRGGTITVMCVQ